jgi:DNA polymerase-1
MKHLQIPLFTPESLWCPPSSFPTMGPVIAIDLETRDPNIKDLGPGWKRDGDGEVVGIAIADEHQKIYLPFAHRSGDNLAQELVLRYTKRCIEGATEVIMANAQYDLGWLRILGLYVPCVVRDIQVAEALIDEERNSYSLDNLAFDYTGQRKDESHLRAVSQAYSDANPGFCPKGDMWQLAARHVGLYAEADARLTWDVYQLQLPELFAQGLYKVFELECQVTKVLVEMSLKGVPVDQARAERLACAMRKEEAAIQARHKGINFQASESVGDYLTKQGINVPKTAKGNISIKNNWLEAHSNPLVQEIANARQIRKIRSDYIEGTIIGSHCYKGRIHAGFRQVTSEDGGTRSGRLSSESPNLQQVPKRSKWGKEVRNLYIPEEGTQWCSADYSGQEVVWQVHYAILTKLPGAVEAGKAIAEGHKLYTFLERETGLSYNICKAIALGLAYGMSVGKLAATMGVGEAEGQRTFDTFNAKVPFLKMLFDNCKASATRKGFIKTHLGRRSHFDQWSAGYIDGQHSQAFPFHKAKQVYEGQRLSRAYTHKALNRVAQGSSGDQMKIALVNLFDAGLDVRLSVHDEANLFITDKKEAVLAKEIMEEAVTISIPTRAEVEVGTSWGEMDYTV